MFQINLSGRDCVSCGICMDVCEPRALDMKTHKARTLEGTLVYQLLDSAATPERAPEPMMTFPFMAAPERCNGCGDCAAQCPTRALTLVNSDAPSETGS